LWVRHQFRTRTGPVRRCDGTSAELDCGHQNPCAPLRQTRYELRRARYHLRQGSRRPPHGIIAKKIIKIAQTGIQDPTEPARRHGPGFLAGVFVVRGGKRIPITSREILNEIASLRANSVKEEKSDGARVVTISDAVFPLTAKQKARLARVEARLPLARA
jgi:hypothetical protein